MPSPHPEILDEWGELIFSWMMAISYQRFLRGVFLRAQIAKILDPKMHRRTEASIETYIPKVLHAA